MRPRTETITVTLHWRGVGGDQSANIVCEDSTPAALLPLLLKGCGLPVDGARPYALRGGSPAAPPLRPDEPVGAQGLRSGDHLWLTAGGAAPPRCVLALPDGSELLIPRAGAALTRAWLLQALALLNPQAHAQEQAHLARRASPYRYVSSRPHCTIGPAATAGLLVATDRDDVVTLLGGAPLRPGAPAQLRDGDRLTLGDGGLPLTVAILGA